VTILEQTKQVGSLGQCSVDGEGQGTGSQSQETGEVNKP